MTPANIDPIRKKRPTINPYLVAAHMVVDRLLWEINPKSWRSRRRLSKIYNSKKGNKAVILCNGPSLLKSDFELMKGVDTFGLNKINLIFDKTEFRPSYIVAVNPHVLEQNATFFNQTEIPLFLDSKGSAFLKSKANTNFLHTWHHARFAQNCGISVAQGNTVTFVALQLAFHMGYSDVALVGCDHYFKAEGPANMEIASGSKDEDHFDPNYFAHGMKWQLPDLPASEFYYSMAHRHFRAHDRRITNATEGGNLEIFPRQSLQEWVADSA
jgi:hypothetical protein